MYHGLYHAPENKYETHIVLAYEVFYLYTLNDRLTVSS